MSGNLSCSAERSGDTVVLAVRGRLDTLSAAELEEHLLREAAGAMRLVVDLSGVSYVSSAGLRVLLVAGKALDAKGGTLSLCGLSEPVARVFTIAGFDRLFPIHADCGAARTAGMS